MADKPLDLFVPADIQQELEDVARRYRISYEWLCKLYQRGFQAQLGATGEHPYGDLGPGDAGGLNAAITIDRQYGVVKLIFGKSVKWLTMPSGQARQLAAFLIEKADELDKSRC